jgi:uncharacterized protein YkwD
MKKITLKFTYAILLCVFLISCTNDEDGFYEDTAIENVDVSYSVMEYQIISLVNQHRENLGLNVLSVINIVSLEAEEHTNYMIEEGHPSHDNFAARHKNLVLKAKAKSVAENVAYGFSTAEAVVSAWLKSSGHRANIENTTFTDIGISTKMNGEGRNYFTNIFIQR